MCNVNLIIMHLIPSVVAGGFVNTGMVLQFCQDPVDFGWFVSVGFPLDVP